MRVLILGGTDEGRALAGRLALLPGVEVLSSLAGRVASPRLPPGQVRVGGFADTDELADFLTGERVRAVADTTHPFATQITTHAVTACHRLGVPLIAVRRPGWTADPGDRWHRVPDLAAAAAAAADSPPGAVLLTVGRRGVAAFAGDRTHHYVIRSVDPPDRETLPPRREVVLARGPFTPDGELATFRAHHITLLVTKDSGGAPTVAKLVVARKLGVPVLMVDRPPLPAGLTCVSSVDAAAAWVAGLIAVQ